MQDPKSEANERAPLIAPKDQKNQNDNDLESAPLYCVITAPVPFRRTWQLCGSMHDSKANAARKAFAPILAGALVGGALELTILMAVVEPALAKIPLTSHLDSNDLFPVHQNIGLAIMDVIIAVYSAVMYWEMQNAPLSLQRMLLIALVLLDFLMGAFITLCGITGLQNGKDERAAFNIIQGLNLFLFIPVVLGSSKAAATLSKTASALFFNRNKPSDADFIATPPAPRHQTND